MSRFVSAGLQILALGLFCACGETPPSIVLITLDTLRCDRVGAYGSQSGLTPHFDSLASEGLLHEYAFTTMPTTGPAHISIFTGLYPSEHGSLQNAEPIEPELAKQGLAVRLQARGFATAAFVTTRLLSRRATGLQGFEVYDVPRGVLRPGSEAVDGALRWLDVEKRRPVLLWVHLYDAHAPYGDADDKRRGIPLDPEIYGWLEGERLRDPELRRRTNELYEKGVSVADDALGQLVAGVRSRLDSEPYFIVAGDHGESLDEHLVARGWAYDHGEFLDLDTLCVPLVVAGPDVLPGRSRSAASLRDLYTTLLGAAGFPDPSGAVAGRRDLRLARHQRRVVVAERRRLSPLERRTSRDHAVAVLDGEHAVIVGETGELTRRSDAGVAPDLLTLAARHLARRAERPGTPPLDPSILEALRSLGYAQP